MLAFSLERSATLANGEYVLAFAGDPRSNQLAVAGSSCSISLYDRLTLQRVRSCGELDGLRKLKPAHDDRINELAFAPSHADAAASQLWSCASDATVRAWDPAVGGKAVSSYTTREHGEAWSVAVDGHLVAAGAGCAVLVWDVRRGGRPMRTYEVHTEAVTQVRFKPGAGAAAEKPTLLSASVDGLLCALDLSEEDEEEAVGEVHNTEAPISSFGFYGGGGAEWGSLAYVVSSLETLSLWDLSQGDCVHALSNIKRPQPDGEDGVTDRVAAPAWPLPAGLSPQVDFVVGCAWDEARRRLVLLGGEPDGACSLFEVHTETGALARVAAMPGAGAAGCGGPIGGGGGGGGHREPVRCLSWGGWLTAHRDHGLHSISARLTGDGGRFPGTFPAGALLPLGGRLAGHRRRGRLDPRLGRAERRAHRRCGALIARAQRSG